ncbi:putative phosphopyruvate hydratase [Helianthus debilis subsp. tardiflorus]
MTSWILFQSILTLDLFPSIFSSLRFPEHIQRSSKSKVVIKKIYDHNATNVGDEGGFAPNIKERKSSIWSMS